MLSAALVEGHVLLEGVPGIGKTKLLRTIADVLGLEYGRVQFTPDLMPPDITGNRVLKNDEFVFVPGPVFCNLLLADEINRAPAKTQAALLEAMEERQVTVGGKTSPLPGPFIVVATQNPLEQEGTYPLPEAQLDRFLMRVFVDYPSIEEEIDIVERHAYTGAPRAQSVSSAQELLTLRKQVDEIYMDPFVRRYAVELVDATRHPNRYGLDEKLSNYIRVGASPRGSLAMDKLARVSAAINGRIYALPEDVRRHAVSVLNHRLVLSYEARADGRDAFSIAQEIVDTVNGPLVDPEQLLKAAHATT